MSNAAPVRLSIFSLLGQEIRTLVEGVRVPGIYTVRWDGKDGHGSELSAGVYVYRLKAGSFSETKRMVLVK